MGAVKPAVDVDNAAGNPSASSSPSTFAGLKFVVDEPADVDTFDVHSRVAGAIVDVVRDQPQVKTIGLLGGWGSGKSTVVNLVRARLAEGPDDERVRCFVYDTWIRQSDPPRRAFLEGLIAFLAEPESADAAALQEQWDEDLAVFKGQREVAETESSFAVTKPGLVMLPALAGLAVGVKLIGDGTLVYELQDDPWAIAIFVLGWVLTLAPLVAALGLRIAGYPFAQILALFANKPGEKKREVRTRPLEPTAIEFQALFKKILEEGLPKGQRLVIVIDNLDRLRSGEAVALWATMRGFFLEARSDTKASSSGLPTVIVPIDPSAPGRIHRATGAPEGDLSQSFLEKTFDLLFHVPPPVLSSWQDYLEKRLERVFRDELRSEWPYRIRVIYEAFHRRRGGAEVTPRSLNTFVNELATLWAQWRYDDIEMASIAYFVCDRRNIVSDLHAALQTPVLAIDAFDTDWRLSIAALCFGVPKGRAAELYMRDPIRSAIASENAKAFAELSVDPGFDRYFDQVLDDPSQISVLAAARLLDLADMDERPWAEGAWRRLREHARTYLHSHTFGPGDDDAIGLLVAQTPQDLRPDYLAAMAQMMLGASAERLLRDEARFTARVVERLVGEATAVGLSEIEIPTPPSPSIYIWIVGQPLSMTARRALKPAHSWDAIADELETMLRHVENREALGGLRAAMALVDLVPETLGRQQTLDLIATNLQTGNGVRAAAAAALIAQLYAPVQLARERALALRDQNVLRDALVRLWPHLAEDTQVLDGAAALVGLMLALGTPADTPDSTGWANTFSRHSDFAGRIDLWLRYLSAQDGVEPLYRMLVDQPAYAELFRGIGAARAPRLGSEAAVRAAMDNLPSYIDLLPSAGAFWRDLSALPGFWDAVAAQDLAVATSIYRALASAEGSKSQLAKQIKARLSSIPADNWAAALDQGAPPYALVEQLNLFPQSTVTIAGELPAVLEGALQTVLDDGDLGRRRRWFELVRWTPAPVRSRLTSGIAAALLDRAQPVRLSELLTAGGEHLTGEGGLGSASGDALAKLVLSLLSEQAGLEWLASEAQEVVPWIAAMDTASASRVYGEVTALKLRDHSIADNLLAMWFAEGSGGPATQSVAGRP
jgi:hypothetical protein